MVRKYCALLNLDNPRAATNGILGLLAPSFQYGGCRPANSEPLTGGLDQVRMRGRMDKRDHRSGKAEDIASQADFAAYEAQMVGSGQSVSTTIWGPSQERKPSSAYGQDQRGCARHARWY